MQWYVCVWCWLVCTSAEVSEDAEEDEPTVEHVGIEVAYEWTHITHVVAEELPHTLPTALNLVVGWW